MMTIRIRMQKGAAGDTQGAGRLTSSTGATSARRVSACNVVQYEHVRAQPRKTCGLIQDIEHRVGWCGVAWCGVVVVRGRSKYLNVGTLRGCDPARWAEAPHSCTPDHAVTQETLCAAEQCDWRNSQGGLFASTREAVLRRERGVERCHTCQERVRRGSGEGGGCTWPRSACSGRSQPPYQTRY